jgi:putative hydrolase of the HAD superfamily
MKTDNELRIKAVLFDIGNTLVYSRPEETFQEILLAHGIRQPLNRVKQALTVGNREFDIEEHVHLSAHEFYTEWNLVHLKHLGIGPANARKLAEEINLEWFRFAQFYVFPDVKRTLQRLRMRRLKLGVITGGYEEDMKEILPKVELQRFFDVCVGVNTVGKRKPSKEAFEYALKQLCVKPTEAVFVGDDLEADYYGAEKAGMIPVLIRREGSPVPDVRSVQSLDGIFQVLEELNP